MEREIKFRIWDNNLKVLYTPEMNIKEPNLWSIPKLEGGILKVSDDIIVMQYTGFKDKKGREIYESDIVICTDGSDEIDNLDSDTGIGIIEWLDNWGLWNISKIENGIGDILQNGYIEVIGNIYENPELL